MLVDREGLWFRVLTARYGVERGRLRDGGRRGSSWWREISRIRDSGGGIGGEMCGEHILRKVGDKSDTLFWTDPWVDGTPLCKWFGRLFDLAKTKSCSVAEMFSLRRGWWRGAQSLDRWQWEPDHDKGYTVRGAYQLLTSRDSITLDAASGLIWHTQIPLKVSICAWRLLCDKLPTTANLVTRCILSPEDHHCMSGCGAVESAQHLFLSCSTFGSLWSLVSSWIGSSSVDSHILPDILFSLLIQQVVPERVVFSCNSSGLRAFGLCGMNETIDCSETQETLYNKCWTRSIFFPIGG
ncbi:hypothetical protein TSUD_26040 [Trifolium subterraneum]|uniref:Reverse transcriptase zinc-binding domain-containing protein n=1 Tax=Trifolium subterraneum TaxID=3900 RepID=A0A2Z6N9L3_TRISU|nr:hypothetical protein TSUD_26040 [Trifolium subterraneum]